MPPAEDLNQLVQKGTSPPTFEIAAPALEVVRTLEEKFNALVAKVDELDRRLGDAETRLAEIVSENEQQER